MKLKTPLAYDSSDTLALLLGSTEAEMIRLYHSLLEEITNNPSEISMNVLEALDQLFPPGDQPEFLAKTGAALGTALDHVTDRALRRKLNSLVYRLDGLKRKGQKPSPKQKRKIIKVFNSNQTEEFRKAYEAYLDWIGAPPEDYNKLKNQNDFIVFLTDADIVFRKSGKIAETSKASVATLRNQTTDPRTTTQLPPGLRLEMREELEILELLFPENTNEN